MSYNSNLKYGLQLPKSKLPAVKAFEEEDDDQDDDEDQAQQQQQSKTGPINYLKQKVNTQVGKQYEDALLEDPTAFEYDSVFDQMKKQQQQKSKSGLMSSNNGDNKPKSKYIGKLLAESEKKKKDFERLKERQIQKEREAEGDQFKDKETFVTQAYKDKLAKEKAEREKEEKQDQEDDVTKKKDLSTFHRNLYKSNINQDQDLDNSNQQQKEKEKEKEKEDEKRYQRRNTEKSIAEARERYLLRKKQREQLQT
eukprot:gene9304-11405_t